MLALHILKQAKVRMNKYTQTQKTHIHIYTHLLTSKHTYINTYIHTYKYTYKHIHTNTYIHTHTHIYIYIYIHTYTHTHIYTRINIYTDTYTYSHIHNTYIYIYTHIHTCINIHIEAILTWTYTCKYSKTPLKFDPNESFICTQTMPWLLPLVIARILFNYNNDNSSADI